MAQEVVSPPVEIVISGYTVSMAVTPTTGMIGDVFSFVGKIGPSGVSLEKIYGALYQNETVVATLNPSIPDGYLRFNWTAHEVGRFVFQWRLFRRA